jgi:hypothetical protein
MVSASYPPTDPGDNNSYGFDPSFSSSNLRLPSMKLSLLLILIIAISTIGTFWVTSVKTATFYPDKHSYSWQSVPKANNGHSDNFEITSYNKPPYNMRGWIEFNVSSIPTDAWVISAELRLRLWSKGDPTLGTGDSTGRLYGVYRLTQPWTQTGVNWVNQPNFTDKHHALAPVPPGQGGWFGPLLWMDWDITDIMRDWQSGTSNYGLVVKDTQEYATTLYTTQFFTNDQVPNKNYYPRLVVTYVFPRNLAIFGGVLVAEGFFIIVTRRMKISSSKSS